MTSRYVYYANFIIASIFFSDGALAQSATAAPAQIEASNVLGVLFLCGMMGLIGQGARVAVGLKTMSDNSASFNLSRLVYSLIIGFIAGFVTALVQWKGDKGLSRIMVSDFDTMIKFAVAGYIGTDVIEAFTTKFFEKQSATQSAATQNATVIPSANVSIAPAAMSALSLQLNDVQNAVATINTNRGPINGTDYPAWALSRDVKLARSKYWSFITTAADTYDLPVSVICAIGSKESQWGVALKPPGAEGTGDFTKRDPAKWGVAMPPDGKGWGRGLTQIDWYSHEFAKSGNWEDPHDNIMYGCKLLADLYKTEINKGHDNITALRCAVSDYNGMSGPNSIYSKDVMARTDCISQQSLDEA